MEIFGYLAALLIGLTLGLIGGGGSILTVPVLVYLLGIDPVLATGYSLFIVGTTASIGAFSLYKMDLVDLRVVWSFAIPSLIAVWVTRAFLLPAIPELLFQWGDFQFTRGVLIMIVFSLLMFAASFSMIRNTNKFRDMEEKGRRNIWKIILDGLVVGSLTGLVGAGGGFLIIPALVLFGGLTMKMAVGTSLAIISIKSLLGFSGDLIAGQEVNWMFLLSFTLIAVIGIYVGTRFSRKIDGRKLKQVFGYFVLIMSLFILIKEFGLV